MSRNSMSWRTIDVIRARVNGGRNRTGGDEFEFQVRYYRRLWKGAMRLDIDDEGEKWRIENKEVNISVEAPTYAEAKQKLRERLSTTESLKGEWSLWVHVEVQGGSTFDDKDADSEREERGACVVRTEFYAHLKTGKRIQHIGYRGRLPVPFTGEWEPPTSHRQLSDLREGLPHCAEEFEHDYSTYGGRRKRKKAEDIDAYLQVTPENLAALRIIQRAVGGQGTKLHRLLRPESIAHSLSDVNEVLRTIGATSEIAKHGPGTSSS